MKIYDYHDDFQESVFRKSSLRALRRKRDDSAPRDSITKEFDLIRRMSTLFGISMKDQPENTNIFFYSLWDTFCFFLDLLLFVISISSLQYLKMTSQISFTFHVYLTLGPLLRVLLLSKRPSICLTARKVSALYRHLGMKSGTCLLHLRNQIIVFFSWFVVMSVILTFYFYHGFNENLNFKMVGFDVSNYSRIYALHVIRISLTYSTVSTTAVLGIALMFCCNFYKAAQLILSEYGKKLLDNSKTTYFSKILLINYISTYKTIVRTFKDIDESVSSSSLLLYASSICCFFNTLSILLSDPKSLSELLVLSQMMISLILSVIIFFALTSTGSKANDEFESLQLTTVESAEQVLVRYYDTQNVLSFRVLTDSIVNLRPTFTGWNLFTINKSLILTTAGAMITYGVLVFQVP